MNEERKILRPKSKYPDSIEKLATHLALLSHHIVLWGPHQKSLNEVPLERVFAGPSLWRTFICTPGCVACCMSFTRDYFPTEPAWLAIPDDQKKSFKVRGVQVNGKEFPVYTVDEMDPYRECEFLTFHRPEGGMGCGLWPNSPLECASAPQLQFLSRGKKSGVTILMKKPFSRAWRWPEHRRPQCQFHANLPNSLTRMADIQLLQRYLWWAEYLQIETVLPRVIQSLKEVYLSATTVPVSSVLLWDRWTHSH